MGHDKCNRVGEMRDIQRIPHSMLDASTLGDALRTHHATVITDKLAVYIAERQHLAVLGPTSELLSCPRMPGIHCGGSWHCGTACCTQHLCAKSWGCLLAAWRDSWGRQVAALGVHLTGHQAYEVRYVRPLYASGLCLS